MNFKQLDRLLMETSYDEVKVIGRDVEWDGQCAHLIGMTLKDRQAVVTVLELQEQHDTEEDAQNFTEKTHRQQMRSDYRNEERTDFLGVSAFRSNGKDYEVSGGTASFIETYNTAECMLLFLAMREHGWRLPEESPLYTADWECLRLVVLELRDEMEALPDWETDLEVVKERMPKTELLEIPLKLTCGEQPVLSFPFRDGTQAMCYINRICIQDVWADFERRFADEAYRSKVLEQISEEEFQKMKEHCEEALLADCPRGKCYMLVEYECSVDVALNFYAASFLDAVPKVHAGSASALLMMHRPEQKEGIHGHTLRGCVIQTPIEPETVSLDAELFAYTETIKQIRKKIY